jgi:hypothetical protein
MIYFRFIVGFILQISTFAHTVTQMANVTTSKKPCDTRRNVAVAGPVYAQFSHICGALKLVREHVATQEISRWNRRNARRARQRLLAQSAALEVHV